MAIRVDVRVRVELMLAALWVVWVFLASLGPTIEFDVWFRMHYGQEVLLQHAVPRLAENLWPYPALPPLSQPGLDWLFCVLVYAVYWLGGLALLPWTKAVLVALLFGLIWRNLRQVKLAPEWCISVSYLVFRLYESRMMLRPQLCTDIFLTLLVGWRLSSTSRLPLKVFLLFCLWSNLHLGVAAGFVFLGVLFVEEDLRARRWPRQAFILVGCALLGSCLRPGGPLFLATIVEHMKAGADHPYNMEWQPMVAATLRGPVGVYLLYSVIGLASLVRRPFALSSAAVVGLAWFLAWRQVRAVGELAALTPALLAAGLAVRLPDPRKLAPALMLVLLLGIGWEIRRPDLLLAVPPNFYPDGAIRFVKSEGSESGVFCSYHFGSYLVFQGLKPFVHGMTTFFPAQRFDDYLAILQSPRPAELLNSYHIGWVMLHYAPEGDVHAALARRLAGSEEWGLVYFDDAAMLFAHKPKWAYRALMPASGDPIVGPPELAREELEHLQRALGPEAALVLQLRAQLGDLPEWNRLLELYPDRAVGLLTRGRLLFGLGRLAESQADLEKYVVVAPESVVGHFNLALVLAKRGNVSGARSQASRALRLDPTFAPASQLLQRL